MKQTAASDRLGYRAQRAVARGLERLQRIQPSAHVVNNVRFDRSDIDHVVVGPTGVFVIETLGYRGKVQLTDAGLTVDGLDPERDPLKQTRRAAASVRSHLRRAGLPTSWVQPVLCLPYAQLDRPECADDVLITRREHLEYFIRHWHGRPLTDRDAGRVLAALQSYAQAAA